MARLGHRTRHIYNLIMLSAISILLLLIPIHSNFIVHSPHELAEHFDKKYGKAGIPYSIANYGEVPYGKSISGKITIPSVW